MAVVFAQCACVSGHRRTCVPDHRRRLPHVLLKLRSPTRAMQWADHSTVATCAVALSTMRGMWAGERGMVVGAGALSTGRGVGPGKLGCEGGCPKYRAGRGAGEVGGL
jgi:hypothetical protein